MGKYTDLPIQKPSEFDVRDELDETANFVRNIELCFHSFVDEEDQILKHKYLFDNIQTPTSQIVQKNKFDAKCEMAKEKTINDRQMGIIQWVANQSKLKSAQKMP